jgi:tRNA threonylcarbamoyladenosine biosynthesis protein TsaE
LQVVRELATPLASNGRTILSRSMSRIIKTVLLKDENATMALGAWLAPFLHAGDVVLLKGDLGAGKTTWARGLICFLLGATEVPSPTYTLVQIYEAPSFEIWHFDLYRLKQENDIWELGIEEALEDGVCLIEWPERIGGLLSGTELTISLNINSTGRTANIIGNAIWEARLADA